MADFKNILVGVDLSRGDWLASADGDTPSHHACDEAIALATAAKAHSDTDTKVHFLAALDLDERTKRLLSEASDDEKTVLSRAEEALKLQAQDASRQGVTAESSVELGSPRTVLVDRAASAGHDLVLIGSRGHGLLSGMLLGSTSIALLSHCTVPVWVVKPSSTTTPKKILVSTDFSPVCNELFDYGLSLAKLFDAELHVTHVVEEASRPFLQFSQIAEDSIQQAHEHAMTDARTKLNALSARAEAAQLSKPLVVHLADGVPSNVVADQTRVLNIDLLLMGTVAWEGVPGMIVGSTAHKMLAMLECSLFTVRPPKK
ncbi:universal stress protein [Aeoliella mucimassa]|uniref:Universal stress protein E n=1 Tax=Aeoliella mucimassa TaxID=2527972 RepID=A0A518AKE4_9BACT|nr:universal stress protein [Aeoliella mucimassa]QDU55201.1 Universal stress protein E [Aeoliella mucimassa]